MYTNHNDDFFEKMRRRARTRVSLCLSAKRIFESFAEKKGGKGALLELSVPPGGGGGWSGKGGGRG